MNFRDTYYRSYQSALYFVPKHIKSKIPDVISGNGSIRHLPNAIRSCNLVKVIIVCSPTVGRLYLPTVLKILTHQGIKFEVFSEVDSDLKPSTVERIYQRYIKNACQGFVALGGGTVINAAKAAAALVAHPTLNISTLAGNFKILRPVPPLIAVPTTGGTGYECLDISLIPEEDTRQKIMIRNRNLVSTYTILDPSLSLSLPAELTAAAGMYCLTRSIEAYLSWMGNSSEELLLEEESICETIAFLERAFQDGTDLEARLQLLTAAYKSGVASRLSGFGNTQALAYALECVYGAPRGLVNAIALPYVLIEYGSSVWRKLAHLSMVTGVQYSGTSKDLATAFINKVWDISRNVKIPSEYGKIKECDLPRLTQLAYSAVNPRCPVPVVLSRKQFEQLFRAMMK